MEQVIGRNLWRRYRVFGLVSGPEVISSIGLDASRYAGRNRMQIACVAPSGFGWWLPTMVLSKFLNTFYFGSDLLIAEIL